MGLPGTGKGSTGGQDSKRKTSDAQQAGASPALVNAAWAPWDPNEGIDPSLSLGTYLSELLGRLSAKGALGTAVSVPVVRELVTRTSALDLEWAELRAKEAGGRGKKKAADLKAEIHKAALTSQEWAVLWSALGGWMREDARADAEARHAVETTKTHDPERLCPGHLKSARARLVGRAGNRGDAITDITDGDWDKWHDEGKLPPVRHLRLTGTNPVSQRRLGEQGYEPYHRMSRGL